MKTPFYQAPFAGLLLALLLGFCIAGAIPYSFGFWWIVIGVSVAVIGLCRYYFSNHVRCWRYRLVPVFCLGCFCVCWGGYIFSQSRQANKMPATETNINACVKILSPPKEKPRSLQCAVSILSCDESAWKGKKIMIALPKDAASMALRVGDCLFLHCRPTAFRNISSAENTTFDYAAYMDKKGFTANAYVAKSSWQKIEAGSSFSLKSLAASCRQRLVDIYIRSGIEGGNLALVSALSLGKKDLMDEDMRNQFASAGVAHILAVSGMHVGIIYLLLGKLLIFMDKWPTGKVLKQILIILSLWFYALITGGSASVIRAVGMFSVVSFGICIQRKSMIWNTLCFSAFVMLCVNPRYIYDVGFQMSYIAVASILWLSPKLLSFMGKKNYLTEMLALSLAAQIGTAPISIYYFHQFPNYFLFGNLLLVPLAIFLTYNALAVLTFVSVPCLGGLLSKLLNFGLSVFCRITQGIDGLPYAVSSDLYPSVGEVIFVYILFILLFLLSENKCYIYRLNQICSIWKNAAYDLKNY